MPGKFALGVTLAFSLLLFLLLLMPARVVVDRLPVLYPGGEPLQLEHVQGLWWRGSSRWRWQSLQGQVRWAVEWQGLVPGVAVRLHGQPSMQLSAWLGADWGAWQLRHLRIDAPVAPFAEFFPQGGADGRIQGTVISLRLDDGAITDLQGTLQYSGGTVTWPGDGMARVPVLDGVMLMDQGRPSLTVSDPDAQRLMLVQITEQRLEVQVKRAWPILLGVSQGGGQPEDVVFQMSQPIHLP